MSKTAKELYKYFGLLIKKYYINYFLLILFAIISKFLLLIPPYINGKIIDYVIIKNFESIIKLLIFCLLIYACNAGISLFETYLNVYLLNEVLAKFKKSLCKKIVYLKMMEFDKNSCGEYLERLDSDTSTICSFYINSLPGLLINIITLIGTGIISIYLSPQLALIGMFSFPISLIINIYFGKKMKILYNKVRNKTDDVTGITQQLLNGEKTIKGLHIENSVLECYKLKIKDLFVTNLHSGMISAYGGLAQTIMSTVFELLIIAIASYYIITGKLTIGEYVSFNVYLSQFLSALRTVANTNINLQTVLVSINRINCIYQQEGEEFSENILTDCGGSYLKISNVEFFYEENQKVLDKINIEFFPNTISAIVGASGGGKTTLLNLILRFYECNAGGIFVDGHSISDIPINILRNKISYIQQDAFFLGDTIKNNLQIVNSVITEEEMKEACEQAGIYEKIKYLSAGFNTMLGENATILSGGERQRLAIARGLLKRSEIFLFDEVTSNLDGNSENKVLKTLFHLAESHIVIVVAHRRSVIEKIPRILVIERGKIVAEGNHEKLLNTSNEYKKLFE